MCLQVTTTEDYTFLITQTNNLGILVPPTKYSNNSKAITITSQEQYERTRRWISYFDGTFSIKKWFPYDSLPILAIYVNVIIKAFIQK